MTGSSAGRVALCVLLLCFSLTSCDLTKQAMRQSMDIDYNDQKLNDGLEGLLHDKKSGRLSDFTSWEWDEVHVFHENSERAFIEKTVGAPVIKDRFYNSKASLLIFELNGNPVKAAGISGDYVRGENFRVTWPADVMLRPEGGGYLTLTLPN
ncbi:hypothetical protein [Mycolicibacterium fortuitum]|uniref:hypothetical protein n=1 Tax=Mycolicibacterium fortuitum TaxID=1766 RepID=UPI000AE435A3|nr:hypothetical protein [Mycolicibacterium fortuitum]